MARSKEKAQTAVELTAQALMTPERIATWRALGSGGCLRAACDIQATVSPSVRLAGVPLCTISTTLPMSSNVSIRPVPRT